MPVALQRFKLAFKKITSDPMDLYRARRAEVQKVVHEIDVALATLLPGQDVDALRQRRTRLGTTLHVLDQAAASGNASEAWVQLDGTHTDARRLLADAVEARRKAGEVTLPPPKDLAGAANAAMTALSRVDDALRRLPPDLAGYAGRMRRDWEALKNEVAKVGTGRGAGKALVDIARRANQMLVAIHDVARQRTPLGVQLGGKPVSIDRRSIPGLDQETPVRQQQVLQTLGAKVQRGEVLAASVLDPASDPDTMPPPTRAQVADLMWYLKALSEQKAGEPYERGALTMPDPDHKLRRWLDRVQELDGTGAVYTRASSHLTQHVGVDPEGGNVARGIDYYDGDLAGGVEHLLPFGMKTALLQSFDIDGQGRLFVKMEPEGARDSIWWTKSADRQANRLRRSGDDVPEDRPRTEDDDARSRAHAWEFIKSRFVSTSVKGLAVRREALHDRDAKAVATAYKQLEKTLRGRPALRPFLELLRRGKWQKEIGAMLDNARAFHEQMATLRNDHMRPFDEKDKAALVAARGALAAFVTAVQREFGVPDLNAPELRERLGAEIVVTSDDLGLDVLARPLDPVLYRGPASGPNWAAIRHLLVGTELPQAARDAAQDAQQRFDRRELPAAPTVEVGGLLRGSDKRLLFRVGSAGRRLQDVDLVAPWHPVTPEFLDTCAQRMQLRRDGLEDARARVRTANEYLEAWVDLGGPAPAAAHDAEEAWHEGDTLRSQSALQLMEELQEQIGSLRLGIDALTAPLTEVDSVHFRARADFRESARLPPKLAEAFASEFNRLFREMNIGAAELRRLERVGDAWVRELGVQAARARSLAVVAPDPEVELQQLERLLRGARDVGSQIDAALKALIKERDDVIPKTLRTAPNREAAADALRVRALIDRRLVDPVPSWRRELIAIEHAAEHVHPTLLDDLEIGERLEAIQEALRSLVEPLREVPRVGQALERVFGEYGV